jgi:TonB-dependent receptor
MFRTLYKSQAVVGISALLVSLLPATVTAQPTQVAAGDVGAAGVGPRPDDPSSPPPSVTRRPGVKAPADEVDPELEGATDDTAGAVDDTAGAVDDTAGAADDTTPPPADPNAADASAADEAAAKGFTGVRGTVVDASTGEGLIEAQVQVVKGGKKATAITEVDGSFELELPPGEYELRVFTALYAGQRVKVTVDAGTAEKVDVKLAPEEGSTEEVVVEAQVEKRTEAAQLQVRRRAATVSDVISAQEISKTPDSSAGDAVKRVVSVTIIDDKYVVLRGLEGRYVTTLLNGVTLPSPEPDRNAVPLDLFPTALLSNLTVIKSYSAEYPGQFGGGALLIETNSYPASFEAKVSASISADSSTTLKSGLANQSGSSAGNFFGYDNGSRQLPDAVPTDGPVRNLTREQNEAIAESFDNTWAIQDRDSEPNFSLGGTVGNTHRLGGRKLGYLATLSFRRKLSSRTLSLTTQNLEAQQDDLSNDVTEQESTIGGLLNTGIELAPGHSINLFGLYTHVGEGASSRVTGFYYQASSDIDRYRLQFVERDLGFLQLSGSHRVPGAGRLELRWQGNASLTHRDELDSRDLAYLLSAEGPTYYNNVGSGQRFFSNLRDQSYGGGLDASLPISRFKLRAGVTAQTSERDLDARRFRYVLRGGDPAVRSLPPDQIFSDENIGPVFRFDEETLQEDAYDASQDVYGVYATGEVELHEKVRAIAGIRAERARQQLQSGSSYAVAGNVATLDRENDDLFPTGAIVVSPRADMNVRLAYSYTLIRPRFREFAPFQYFDYVRNRSVAGNPLLQDSHIHNGDLRWEWFPGESEVFALSTFYKRFNDPIELVTLNPGLDSQFKNAGGATLLGAEVEARASLSRLARALRDVKVGFNLAIMDSSVDLGPGSELLTSQERPMFGQSPYTVNFTLGYSRKSIGDFNLLYNVIGERITDVGIEGIPDIYEQPFHRLDFVAAKDLAGGLRMKASLTNLLNQRVEATQGELVAYGYKPGVGLSLGLEWAPR